MNTTLLFTIADFPLSIEADPSTLSALKKLGGLGPFLSKGSNPEAALYRSGCEISPLGKESAATLLHSFDFEEIDCYFSREGSCLQFDMIPRNGASPLALRHLPGSKLVEASSCSDPTMLRFALWMAYGLLVHKSYRIAVHSSVIVYKTASGEEKAVMFLGESGTGKSTHTRLWRETIPDCYLLNDDSPVICCDGSRALVYGSPWSGKTPCYKQHCCEISAIVRLSQAPANKIKALSRLASLGAILPSCPPAFAYDPQIQNSILDTLSNLLRTVPVYHLECLPDSDAALTVFNTLEQ